MDTVHLVQEVLDFWFGAPDSAELGSRRDIWFQSTPEFDQQIRSRFGEANHLAAAGKLDDLKQSPTGTLVLILLLDQFSRNIFRGTAQAFANDAHARQLTGYALEKRFSENILTVQRIFFCLPLEHAEDLASQERSVALFVNLGDASSLRHALCHRDQIVRFGRFPDRNQALGRKNSPAEEAFLKQPFC